MRNEKLRWEELATRFVSTSSGGTDRPIATATQSPPILQRRTLTLLQATRESHSSLQMSSRINRHICHIAVNDTLI